MIADTERSIGTVRNWTQLELTDGEQRVRRVRPCSSVRGRGRKDHDSITPDHLLVPRRRQDEGGDLWHTLNRVQENVIVGGLSAIRRDANGRRVRRVSTRRIDGTDQDVRLNRARWALAGRMAGLKSEAPKVMDPEFDQTQGGINGKDSGDV